MDLLDDFSKELDQCFGAPHSIALAISANPFSDSFLDKAMLQALADLASLKMDDTELELAKRCFGQRRDVYRNAILVAHSALKRCIVQVASLSCRPMLLFQQQFVNLPLVV